MDNTINLKVSLKTLSGIEEVTKTVACCEISYMSMAHLLQIKARILNYI